MAIKDAIDYYRNADLANTSGMDTSWMGGAQGGSFVDPATGLTYMRALDPNTGQYQYAAVNPSMVAGDQYEIFDGSGKSLGMQTTPADDSPYWGLGQMLAAAGGMAFGLPALMGGSAAGGAGAGAAALEGLAPSTATMGASGAGSAGTGLTLGGGGTGFSSVGAGPGLQLASSGVTAPGMLTAASPGATGIGAGLGAGELLAGTGSLLGPAALSGTTTLSTGLTLPSLGTAAGAAGAAGAGGGSAAGGAGGLGSMLGGNGLGAAATLAGGLLGAQGEQAKTSQSKDLPAWLQGPASTLVGQAQGMVGNQIQAATDQGASMIGKGAQLMGQPVAGNGVGQVRLNAPNTPTNPYATGILDDLQRRSNDLIGQQLNQIAGRQVAAGGMGSTRQGVAQGQAISQGQDQFLGQAANFMGGLYNADQNRALQQYGMDQGFYGQQRGQDLAQVGIGSGLVNQGFQTQWSPLQQAAQVYSPFTGHGTTTQTQSQGGGVTGALGGALGAAQLGKNMGWW